MVALPEINQYSQEQLKAVSHFSPAFKLYSDQLERKPQNFSEQLRLSKHRVWLRCVAATFFEQAGPEKICQFWSEHTETLIHQTWQHCQLEKHPVTLLAFGKLGSRELNLSSDIDVVFVKRQGYENTQLNSSVKNFIKILSEHNSFGFAFRVDADLRPGGPSSPLIPSDIQFYNFFDEFIEPWHRLSFIRMRPILGDQKLMDNLQTYCKKMAYPRRLDFSVLNDIKNIRKKISFQWRKAHEPFDLKFHPGGIRDIELLIHSLQVIYGGRQPQLQCESISQAMDELHKIKAINDQEFQFLSEFYWQLRFIENLIHSQSDQHTYLLDAEKIKVDQSPPIDIDKLNLKLQKASKIAEGFFEPMEPSRTHEPITDKLSKASQRAIAEIKNLESISIKRHKIQNIKSRIIDRFISYSEKIALDQNLAIEIFRDFIFAIKSKTSIFHLLDRHDELLENLAWLFSVSPYVGQVLCRRPELIDSFALGRVAVDDNDVEIFLENLMDYKLLGQLIAIIYFLKNNDIDQFCFKLSEQADFICKKLLDLELKQIDCDSIDVLCMGKWSGFELGVQSDLDLVFVTEEKPSQKQIKVARRMINLLSNPTKGGKLYNIDTRLKPNQSAGPLILEKQAFHQFVKNKAQAWQKQAYFRARRLGEKGLYFGDHLDWLSLNQAESDELNQIHNKLYSSASSEAIDIKLCLGGLVHTEFTLQKIALRSDSRPKSATTKELISSGPFDDATKEQLLENYQFFRSFEQVFQICNDSPRTKVLANNPNLKRVSRILNLDQPFLTLKQRMDTQHKILNSLDLNH